MLISAHTWYHGTWNKFQMVILISLFATMRRSNPCTVWTLNKQPTNSLLFLQHYLWPSRENGIWCLHSTLWHRQSRPHCMYECAQLYILDRDVSLVDMHRRNKSVEWVRNRWNGRDWFFSPSKQFNLISCHFSFVLEVHRTNVSIYERLTWAHAQLSRQTEKIQ